jgi:flavin reductase (DIM6/NTAB) family NADH-FMN oxidoreductase RutF
MTNGGYVHNDDPFATPAAERSPARRLRGRLVAGVTIWTAGPGDDRAGLTMSSVLVADGEPAQMLGLLKDTTDLFEVMDRTRRFVVHVLPHGEAILADVFAGLRPSPGGPFAGLETVDSEWGPVIARVTDRAYCRLVETTDAGYHRLARAEIERVELAELDAPLVYFRGHYRKLD